ncbi:SURF1 family protein [Halocynthiibacter namhaensis]|uniref:SURF1 family protein n=1 Tax=Halocynthiibacter namhaensis TaxID=1290553 RepID=UPI00057974F2|nr:SURF1 family protein [Halocynthiibacter namhaensis]
MNGKTILTVIFGAIGLVILLWLGFWQVSRLAWKNASLAEIELRIQAEPVALPDQLDPERDRYLPVAVTGIASPGVQVFATAKAQGAGFRMLSVFEVKGRRILLDRGYRKQTTPDDLLSEVELSITGNLLWPQEVDGFTPEPEGTTWYARDIPAIAMSLNTEPILIVARSVTPNTFKARPMPVSTEGIPNDHLGYAITWFSLAFIWLVMTAAVVWRIRQQTPKLQ